MMPNKNVRENTKERGEIKEPFQRPPSNHLEVNYISVGYYKHEIDFGVLCAIKELSEDDFNKMLHMLNVAIQVAKEMRNELPKPQPIKPLGILFSNDSVSHTKLNTLKMVNLSAVNVRRR